MVSNVSYEAVPSHSDHLFFRVSFQNDLFCVYTQNKRVLTKRESEKTKKKRRNLIQKRVVDL